MMRIDVAVLGATGAVGQYLAVRLVDHPVFRVRVLAASDVSAGRSYADAVVERWLPSGDVPDALRNIEVADVSPKDGVKIAFSALTSDVAGRVETEWAESGAFVSSNASSHRADDDVPLVIPEVNADHLRLLRRGRGGIVTNPNCTTIMIVLALAPLHKAFGLKALHVSTMQALSGAGYPGHSALDVTGNVVPYIRGEEDKVIFETKKLLGRFARSGVELGRFPVAASCHRVPVLHGHLIDVSARFEKRPSESDVVSAWKRFRPLAKRDLPSAPEQPIIVRDEDDRPQPRPDADAGGGMSVSVGRLRRDPVIRGWRFLAMGHNLVRGAAGAALLNAELLVEKGYLR
jgi:aspartate-semialdehyde dehydrogenase